MSLRKRETKVIKVKTINITLNAHHESPVKELKVAERKKKVKMTVRTKRKAVEVIKVKREVMMLMRILKRLIYLMTMLKIRKAEKVDMVTHIKILIENIVVKILIENILVKIPIRILIRILIQKVDIRTRKIQV